MDYINYVKQSPMMGQIGLGGGATSLGTYAGGFEKPDGYYWGGNRGLVFGGYEGPATINKIEYITISTLGNSTDYGDLPHNNGAGAAASNGTRAVYAGGIIDPSYTEVMHYYTIANTGNGTDFGDMLATNNYGIEGVAGNSSGGASNANRGVFAGGYNPISNVIQYIDITSTGNSTDFGDMIYARRNFSSVTDGSRAVWAGGYSTPTPFIDNMDYTTIATTGNSTNFGDLVRTQMKTDGVSSLTRGVFSGGLLPAAPWYGSLVAITIDTLGNATSIGTQGTSTQGRSAASGNGVYGTFSGGYGTYGKVSGISYIEIDNHTSGYTSSFGNLTTAREYAYGASGD